MRDLPDFFKACKVFPCVPGGKEPATRKGWHIASNDPEQIAEWQRINPNFNWAVATGMSGLFVIDVDPDGLAYWHRLLESDPEIRAAVERAFQVRTPRGGLHIYFRGEGPSTVKRIADGIDTRGGIHRDGKIVSGGYVLLPGSKTDKGTYTALPGGDLFDLPDCIRAIIPERKKTSTLGLEKNPTKDQPRNIAFARDRLIDFVKRGEVAIPGSSDDTTYKVACAVLSKAITPETCFELMWEHWVPHAKMPIDDWWIEQKIHSAYENGEDTKTGVAGFQANTDAFAKFEGLEFEPPEKRKRYEVMRLSDARRDKRETRWLIPDYVPAAGVGVLYGKSGSYKTFMMLDWALCLAFGVAGQWNAPPVKHNVLLLAGENSHALQEQRVNAWCEYHGKDPDDAELYIVRGVPAYSDTEGWKQICEGLDELGIRPDFIGIDTLARAMIGLKEDSNDDGKIMLAFLEEFASRYNAFILGIGHTGKDVSKGLRGAQALIDFSETAHSMQKKGKDLIQLTVHKVKESEEPDQPTFFKVTQIEKDDWKSVVLLRTDEKPIEGKQKPTSSYEWASVEEVIRILETNGGETSDSVLCLEIAGAHGGLDKNLVHKQLQNSDELKFLRASGERWKIPKREYDL